MLGERTSKKSSAFAFAAADAPLLLQPFIVCQDLLFLSRVRVFPLLRAVKILRLSPSLYVICPWPTIVGRSRLWPNVCVGFALSGGQIVRTIYGCEGAPGAIRVLRGFVGPFPRNIAPVPRFPLI